MTDPVHSTRFVGSQPATETRGDDVTGVIRTCIGCRLRTPRSNLLRVVAREGQVIADPRAIHPGRGAWLHVACLEEAERRKAFARALRAPGLLDLEPIRSWCAQSDTAPAQG